MWVQVRGRHRAWAYRWGPPPGKGLGSSLTNRIEDRAQGAPMKKFFLATTAIVALGAGSAVAADLAVKAPPRAPCNCTCDAAKFAGGYVGINGGSVVWTANRTDQDQVLIDSASYVQKKWGGVIGGQIGYNWTTCHTLWGFEVDGDWSSTKVTTQLITNASPLLNINIQSRF